MRVVDVVQQQRETDRLLKQTNKRRFACRMRLCPLAHSLVDSTKTCFAQQNVSMPRPVLAATVMTLSSSLPLSIHLRFRRGLVRNSLRARVSRPRQPTSAVGTVVDAAVKSGAPHDAVDRVGVADKRIGVNRNQHSRQQRRTKRWRLRCSSPAPTIGRCRAPAS